MVGLLLAALGLVFYAVNRASIDNAMERINSDLDITAQAFSRVLEARIQNLLERARFLSSDHAYRQIYGFGEREDLELVTFNHQRRIGADMMMLISMDEEVLADTLHPGNVEMSASLEDFVYRAFDSDDGEATAMLRVDGIPYQLVVVPLYAPDPVAMVVVGFRVDEELVSELKEDTNFTDVSLLFGLEESVTTTAACTLGPALCEEQAVQLITRPPRIGEQETRRLGGEPYVTRVLPLQEGDRNNVAILQRSLNAELASYFRLRNILFLIFGGSVVLSVIGGSVLSGTVTRPVAVLTEGARRIARGEYDASVDIPQRDEMGRLANTFNDMARGLQERDQVRNLLGKVVSPQIADELLKKDIELGGEEVEASILFSDIRGFTNISEAMSPQQVIQMLNHYLTEMNNIIESHRGVVDKYIGDAVMAIFGAPLPDPESPINAVRSALEMQSAMSAINRKFRDWNIPEIEIGIGINTGTVVAGNMGSMSRLNYTVLGDAVNLASRLEGLCKLYGTPVIISEFTRAACPGLKCMELDRVTVKGKSEPVSLFQPLAENAADEATLQRHQEALQAYRDQDWPLAMRLLSSLQETAPRPVYQLYQDRINHFTLNPPGPGWDGVFVLNTK
ncbi:MAG: adenylate/guanylate cyclase domain-containing protein [Halieaceae bacterium]